MAWWKKAIATISKPSVIVASALSSPVSFIKAPRETVKTFLSQPITTQAAKGALAGAGLGLLAGGGAGLRTAATFAKTKTAAILGLGATAAIVAPRTTEIIAKEPALRDVAVGTAIGGPIMGGVVALEKGGGIISRAAQEFGPEIKTAAAAVGIGATLAAGAYGVSKLFGKDEDMPTLDKEAIVGVGNTSQPILPETTSVTATKRRYKPRTAKKTPSVRQSVRVNVQNVSRSSANKKYIKTSYIG